MLLEKEFLSYNSKEWHVYKNPLEDKKTINNWNLFPSNTYNTFSYLNSNEFVNFLSSLYNVNLYSDAGLHGGGWHIHKAGGNLNPHLDYSIHPKLFLQRRLNLIIYLSEKLAPSHGGHLGFWSHDNMNNSPKDLAVEIEPKFNRAVLFDTSQNSWHGTSRNLSMPLNIYRKSLAIYYLSKPVKNADSRARALYAPRENQVNDKKIKKLILLRSGVNSSSKVYRKK